MAKRICFSVGLVATTLILVATHRVAAAGSKEQPPAASDDTAGKQEPPPPSPFLVEERETAFQILKFHRNASHPLSKEANDALTYFHQPSAVLAYVTPWNADGYRRAISQRARLTHVSPVWFSAKPPAKAEGRTFVNIGGEHHVNATWCRLVSTGSDAETQDGADLQPGYVQIVPRLNLEGWTNEQLTHLFQPLESSPDAKATREALLGSLDKVLRRHPGLFRGIVLEWGHVPLSTKGLQPGGTSLLVAIKAAVAEALGLANVTLVLAVSADSDSVGPAEVKWLVRDAGVNFLSVMSYDYATTVAGAKAPNSPYPWFVGYIRALEKKKKSRKHMGKILMGLNFYGNIFRPNEQPEAVTGRDAVAVFQREYARAKKTNSKGPLKPTPTLFWDPKAKEHSFESDATGGGRAETYLPTRAALAWRMMQVRAAGAGVAIWELGQGLEYFAAVLPERPSTL